MFYKSIVFFSCFFLSIHASGRSAQKKTICLNMIVKDEAPVIERCLKSLEGMIDYWVIVDTGSKDGTQNIIKDVLKNIPGELLEKPWENFEVNRNQALHQSKNKGDYILFIDADEWLVFDETFKLPNLDKDYYAITDRCFGIENKCIFLINNHLDWYWKGVIHEDILSDTAKSRALLTGVIKIEKPNEGNRSQDPLKYQKDAAVLEKAVLDEPNNSRYYFYLGETCTQIKQYEKALQAFEKRITMDGWEEEIFWSYYRIAFLKEVLNRSTDEVVSAYTQAYLSRPTRAEPLYKLAAYYQKNKNTLLAYLLLKEASHMPMPKETMFLEHFIYDFGVLIALSDCSCILGRFDETSEICKKLLSKKGIPKNSREQIEQNLQWVTAQLEHRQNIKLQANK